MHELDISTRVLHGYDAFIGYNSGDREEVDNIARELEDAGLSVWKNDWENKSQAELKGEVKTMKIISVSLLAVVCFLVQGSANRLAAQVFSRDDLKQIEEVQTKGVGTRFVVPLLDVAARSGWRTTVLFHSAKAAIPIELPSGGKENPVYFSTRYDLREPKLPKFLKIGDGCVLVFTGDDIPLRDWTFYSSRENPLTFLVMKGKGLVYLSGMGKVQSPDGQTTNLPSVP